ncbi:MAG: hypothetical protein ACOCRX_05450 [Candidatus Woesearchaeota archaeon]
MRIISKFHDYYDTSLSYGIDDNIIYKREKINLDKNDPNFQKLFKELKSTSDFNSLERFIMSRIRINDVFDHLLNFEGFGNIFFCLKSYPFLEFEISDSVKNYKNVYVYNIEQFEKDCVKDLSEKDKKFLHKKSKFSKKSLYDKVIDYFKDNYHDYSNNEILMSLHLEYETPIIAKFENKYFQSEKVIINPILKDFDFYRAVDPFTAFQEISNFMGNYIGKKGNETVEIDDNIRAELHGFNKESFRKPPKKKK